MSLNTNAMKQASGNTLGYPTVGAHVSRLIGVVDLGVQERQPYKGKPKSPCGQVLMTYELTDDFVEINGEKKPRWISKKENAFSGQNANLTALVLALDPGGVYGGDLGAMARATVPCMTTIAQKTDPATNAPIEGVRLVGVSGLPASFPVEVAKNPPLVFDWEAPDMAAYDRLPGWVQEQIKKAHNFKGSKIEPLIAEYDVQKAAQNQQQAAGQPQTAGNGVPVGQSVAPAPQPAPAAAQAVNVPVAPPGYEWDQATNTFKPVAQKPVEQVQTAPATPAAPPGWKLVNGQWVPDTVQPAVAAGAPAGGRPY